MSYRAHGSIFCSIVFCVYLLNNFHSIVAVEKAEQGKARPSVSGAALLLQSPANAHLVKLHFQDYGPKVNFKKQKVKTEVFTGLPNFSKFVYDRMLSVPNLTDFQPVEHTGFFVGDVIFS